MTSRSGLVLLDTSILVHLIRESPLGKHVMEQEQLRSRGEQPLICVVTVGEMLSLGRHWKWGGPKLARLDELLSELVTVDISSRDVLERYAEIDHWCRENGKKLSKNDLWISAAASTAGATLLTTDGDFGPLEGKFLEQVCFDEKVDHPVG